MDAPVFASASEALDMVYAGLRFLATEMRPD